MRRCRPGGSLHASGSCMVSCHSSCMRKGQQGSGSAHMRSAAPACMASCHAAAVLARAGADMLGITNTGAGLSSGGTAVARQPPGPKQHVPRWHSLCAAHSACAAAPFGAAAPRPFPAARAAQQRQWRFLQDPRPGPPGTVQRQMLKVYPHVGAMLFVGICLLPHDFWVVPLLRDVGPFAWC
jgi:hypothetical protein